MKPACATASCSLAPDEEGEAGRAESRILECRRLRAPAEIARALDLRAGETVVMIRRLLSMGQTPTVLDDIWLPGSIFRGLTFELLSANKAPLYGLFESEFGVSMVRADESCAPWRRRPKPVRCLMLPPARRCCRWIACRTRMVTAPWKSGGACT